MTTGIEKPNRLINPNPFSQRQTEPEQAAPLEEASPPQPAVEPGMLTEPPPDCTPGHLNGKIFWNTNRQAPPGPTWNDIIRKAGPGGFPGRRGTPDQHAKP